MSCNTGWTILPTLFRVPPGIGHLGFPEGPFVPGHDEGAWRGNRRGCFVTTAP